MVSLDLPSRAYSARTSPPRPPRNGSVWRYTAIHHARTLQASTPRTSYWKRGVASPPRALTQDDDSDADVQLTAAELEMIQSDYVVDDDAPTLIPPELEELFPEDPKADREFEFLLESEDQGYADRKEFVDPKALEAAKAFGRAMAVVADSLKCQSIRLLDVHTKLYWTDMFLIVTAMSRTQLSAVLGKMEKVAREEWDIEVDEAITKRSEWECIDFGSLVVHAFSPRTREYYRLDEIYAACEEVRLRRPLRDVTAVLDRGRLWAGSHITQLAAIPQRLEVYDKTSDQTVTSEENILSCLVCDELAWTLDNPAAMLHASSLQFTRIRYTRHFRRLQTTHHNCRANRYRPLRAQRTNMSSCGREARTNATVGGLSALEDTKTYDVVKDYYGKVLETSKDLKTSACTAAGSPHPVIVNVMRDIPAEIVSKFYGCGAPLPLGVKGLRVLDLGSGSGRDCYVCSALVGESGHVTGIDMTDEQVAVSNKYLTEFTQKLGYAKPNMKFVTGHIEYLDKAGIEDNSIDLVISNCVVNLSPDKPRVLQEVYRVLAPGGELYFSDVYCDRRLPEHVQKHEVLWGECISGALYDEDFKRIARDVGFEDARVLSCAEIKVTDPELQEITGEARFYSITYRLFKLPGLLESLCEDYGQLAIYKGTIEGHKNAYQLDDHHRFETGKPMPVCGNTAAMVGEGKVSWLAPHFEVVGDRSVHYGLFDCSGPKITGPAASVAPSTGDSCCG